MYEELQNIHKLMQGASEEDRLEATFQLEEIKRKLEEGKKELANG